MERRGPHKSMHCKFCKPPGAPTAPENPQPAQLETKTKLHLAHQGADLKVFDVFDEPGQASIERDACICQLEGYQPCPKCAPDKKKIIRKKACDCPPGSKPHPNMAGMVLSQKKKIKMMNDDEFWWEKYDREHDAIAKETWAAYMAQRRQDKKLAKCQEKEGVDVNTVMKPKWYQKLSCQQVLKLHLRPNLRSKTVDDIEGSIAEALPSSRNQVIYLEYLSTAIRLDLDENITDRTFFVLGGLGLYPRPKRKILQKCLRYCHYNAIRFLNQLVLLIQDEDPFGERVRPPGTALKSQDLLAWNDRIVMSCICYLEFPKLLREIMDRLPPLPQDKLLPPIPKPKFPRPPVRQYDSPYDEPVWRERLNWVEKQKIERINRARQHMDTKRVKIPDLALLRRPSLIDARPPFLSQIEANQSFHRHRKPSKKKIRMFRKKKKATFDSKVDITAIAGIEASEVSTTPKADSEDICVFLREQNRKLVSTPEDQFEDESEEGEEEGEFDDEGPLVPIDVMTLSQDQSTKSDSLTVGDSEFVLEEDRQLDDEDDIPFVTPPKTESGATIESPCPPPKGSPGPPASHYDVAKRELGLINQELCQFDPNKERSNDDEENAKEISIQNIDVEDQLKKVAQKLKELQRGDDEEEEGEEGGGEKRAKKKKKKCKRKCRRKSKKCKKKLARVPEEPEPLPDFVDARSNPSEFGMNFDEEYGEMEGEYGEMDLMTGEIESDITCVCTEDLEDGKKVKKTPAAGKKKKRRRRKRSKKGKCKKESKNVKSGRRSQTKRKFGKKTGLEVAAVRECTDVDPDDSESCVSPESEEDKVFYGEVEPLLRTILKDLNDEGFISAGYSDIDEHPDIKQLIKHLQGEIVNQKSKKYLQIMWRGFWKGLDKKGKSRAPCPDLGISTHKYETATWSDKKWIAKLAGRKKEEYFFNIAKNRANEAKDFYLTLYQEYFGTERFLNIYYAYMIAKKNDCILRGLP